MSRTARSCGANTLTLKASQVLRLAENFTCLTQAGESRLYYWWRISPVTIGSHPRTRWRKRSQRKDELFSNWSRATLLGKGNGHMRSEEHTSELQSLRH